VLYSLSIDETTPPIETIFGWHIIQRQENTEGQFVHILVSHNDARESRGERSVKQARHRIEQARIKILTGEDPVAVATEYSDGPAGSRGGSLGWISAPDLHPVFEAAAFSVEAGQLSEIIESPYGFHLFVRYK
jgi:parvulin-like peptidyl-prolyl isomerase